MIEPAGYMIELSRLLFRCPFKDRLQTFLLVCCSVSLRLHILKPGNSCGGSGNTRQGVVSLSLVYFCIIRALNG
jgi:hypothetical protein